MSFANAVLVASQKGTEASISYQLSTALHAAHPSCQSEPHTHRPSPGNPTYTMAVQFNPPCSRTQIPVPLAQGCGVWLPDAPFTGPSWFKTINAELFQGYSHWHLHFLETAATAAVKNLASTFVFFHWSARNTGGCQGWCTCDWCANAAQVVHRFV